MMLTEAGGLLSQKDNDLGVVSPENQTAEVSVSTNLCQ